MNGTFEDFLNLPEQDKRDVWEKAADRLDTLPGYVEKDFWVSLVLETLFNRLPEGSPRLFFKGGTSLTKVFGLIRRFSEDVDLVVDRAALGFAGEQDPAAADQLSNNRRHALFGRLKKACSDYILGELRTTLTELFVRISDECRVIPDRADRDKQTLFIEYPTLYPSDSLPYVVPRVKVEAGARSALTPSLLSTVTPYIAEELSHWSFIVDNVRTIDSARTYWEKLLILHGRYYGYQGERRLPTDQDRISRHYYDVAMITETETGRTALSNVDLLNAVREYNLIAFRQAWKQFEKAHPGTVKLVPQPELCAVIKQDYQDMQDMILGDAPDFTWVMSQIQRAETAINESASRPEGS